MEMGKHEQGGTHTAEARHRTLTVAEMTFARALSWFVNLSCQNTDNNLMAGQR